MDMNTQGGLLGNAPSVPQQAPQQMGGLLGGGQPAQAPGGDIPPQLIQAIQQMKTAPEAQKQAFIQHIVQTIQGSQKDPAEKQQALQQFMQMMGGQ